MRFHAVHGSNVVIEESGSRAVRTSSFCDAIAFSQKPLPVNSRVAVLLRTNEEWSGALRLGVTAKDPSTLATSGLPRYACPDLISRQGFWARPLPEKWASDGTRLTFYVSSQGHFQLFVNNEHKGALLSGLPVKEHLWLIFDLYGITFSIAFVATAGYAPVEVLARGPEALQAYQKACADGSVASHRTRVALIGPHTPYKEFFKKALLGHREPEEGAGGTGQSAAHRAIDCTYFGQTGEQANGTAWNTLNGYSTSSDANEELYDSDESSSNDDDLIEEEYYQAIAKNIVREIMMQKKKKKQEERKKTALVRGALRLQSNLSRRGLYKGASQQPSRMSTRSGHDGGSKILDDFPTELPKKLVDLVEEMLTEAESKQDWDKVEAEIKEKDSKPCITINVWDFDGHPKYFAMHQAFISPKTLYVLVLDASSDPEEELLVGGAWKGTELPDGEYLSTWEMVDVWLTGLHASVAHSNSNVDTEGSAEPTGPEPGEPETEDNNKANSRLQPHVIVVGLKHSSVERETVELNLSKLKDKVSKKAYGGHVLRPFFVVDCDDQFEADQQATRVRRKIEETALSLPHVGMEIPLRWLAFERMVDRLLERNIYMADLMQLFEVAHREGLDDEQSFCSMIEFYHQQGRLLHFESGGDRSGRWSNAVILQPQWFIEHAYQIFALGASDTKFEKGAIVGESLLEGVISKTLMDRVLTEVQDQRIILLGILENLDLICEVENSEMFDETGGEKSYLVPWNTGLDIDFSEEYPGSVTLVVDCQGLLPIGLFTRLVSRMCRWSERHRWQREPQVNRRRSRIAVDRAYDVILKRMSNELARIEVTIVKAQAVAKGQESNVDYPAQHVCAKVRHLLENELEALRDSWFSRFSFVLSVACPCAKECAAHGVVTCPKEECAHFLQLNQCLINKAVQCDFRRVKTDFIRKFFPEASVLGIRSVNKRDSLYSSKELMASGSSSQDVQSHWDVNHGAKDDPAWVKRAVKMLSGAAAGRDWLTLSKRLGYGEKDITNFEDDVYPAGALLRNWLDSNARTRYSVDILLFALEQMGRDDVAEIIRDDLEPEEPAPPIFISYQWDSQAAVLSLRRRLELCGFPCWMDVGQMGGGDNLYGKIYEGISRAKVVLCCLTPLYVVSQTSTREASLADVLRKPILPVMLEPVPWPPPGPLAVVFSPMVYIALCGIGGHGGNGRQADWESRFQEILNRLSQYVMPIPGFNHHMASPMVRPPALTTGVHTPSLGPIGEDFATADEPLRTEEMVRDDLFEGDTYSTYSEDSARGRAPGRNWRPVREGNRVTRCSVCDLL